jgi:hypothetical protein
LAFFYIVGEPYFMFILLMLAEKVELFVTNCRSSTLTRWGRGKRTGNIEMQ